MAKFLNKKEQVYDIKLTSYGRHLLSIGKFKPVYYEFYDDNILYDKKYTTSRYNSIEPQNDAHKRIKQDTPYFESLVLFEEVENNLTNLDYTYDSDYETELAQYSTDVIPTQKIPRTDAFLINQGIGDAYLDTTSNKAPAWKVVALESLITSSVIPVGSNTSVDSFANRNTNIPQININSTYYKKIGSPDPNTNPNRVEDFYDQSLEFADGQTIKIIAENPLLYVEELNSALLTENFDIEVFEHAFVPCTHATGSIKINSQPAANDSIIIATTVDNYVAGEYYQYVFRAGTPPSDSGATRYVAIGASVVATAANLAEKIQDTIDDADATLDKSYTVTFPDGGDSQRMIIMNTVPCTVGNTGTIEALVESTAGTFEIKSFAAGSESTNELKRKYFVNKMEQVVDGFMVSAQPQSAAPDIYTTGSVEYYFDIVADTEIEEATACKGAQVFNKQSYYVDLDFECDTEEDIDNIFYDIYGRVTEPEVCLD